MKKRSEIVRILSRMFFLLHMLQRKFRNKFSKSR